MSGGPSTRQRAWVVAAVRALGARAEAACAHRWPEAPAVRELARSLFASGALAAEALQLDRARPSGLGEVHRSWYEVPPPSNRPDATAWLERSAYGALVDMLAPPSSQPPALERLERLGADALVELIERLGRRRVATAFLSASRAQIAQLCARLGEPGASQLLDELGLVYRQALHDEVRAARAALLHVDVDGAGARSLFLRVGSAWLAPALTARGADRLQQLAQKMPRHAGAALIAAGDTPATEADNAAALALTGLLASELRGA